MFSFFAYRRKKTDLYKKRKGVDEYIYLYIPYKGLKSNNKIIEEKYKICKNR